MAESENFIIDEGLPDALNFEVLMSKGIDQLKAIVGDVWSNYNDSDPGVTILEQLCYALTELGYCAQFPIADLLTGKDGKIRYDGQFFAPQDVLTTSPVTVDDYRRMVHDRMDCVRAIYIVPENQQDGDGASGRPTGNYLTYVSLNPAAGEAPPLLAGVHLLLNRYRRLSEWFLSPVPLRPKPITLAGAISLAPLARADKVLRQVVNALNAYAVPPAMRLGYQELRDQGLQADQIFNGPRLDNGWIGGAPNLAPKCAGVSLFSLNALLLSIEGVADVTGLHFTVTPAVNHIDIATEEIPEFLLQLTIAGVAADAADATAMWNASRQPDPTASVAAAVDRYPDPPQGEYRGVEQYYSIQNTFPDNYGVGYNSLQSEFPQPRVASARQLKGYLMVYDQLLANQFSQLAHAGELFSFPQQHHARARSYYFQPLYDVPDVKSLLQGTEAFAFRYDPAMSESAAAREAWKRYKKADFNEYIHGLNYIMDPVAQAEARRDNLLTHLMARHGDHAGDYDDMIASAQWYGSAARTRIVVKSIWLQNYPLLSYYRGRAFDPAAAAKLDTLANMAWPPDRPRRPAYPTIRGQLDETAIYNRAELTDTDFQKFSAFELTADIFLGLSAHLLALSEKLESLLNDSGFLQWLPLNGAIADQCYRSPESDISVLVAAGGHRLLERGRALMDLLPRLSKQPLGGGDYQSYLYQLRWLATQRKGMILIEHMLLLPDGGHGGPATASAAPSDLLQASLMVPDYVNLVHQPEFKKFVDILVERHWPAHLGFHYAPVTFNYLNGWIPQFVNWFNQPPAAAAPARGAAAQVLKRLLNLLPPPAPRGASHAG